MPGMTFRVVAVLAIAAAVAHHVTAAEMEEGWATAALIKAAETGNIRIIEGILAKSGDFKTKALEVKTKGGMTALMAAAYYGHAPAVELLLSQGANIEATNNDGATALMFAASKGRLPTMRLLLSWRGKGVLPANGADVTAVSNDGYTALHLAAGNGETAAAKILLGNGADVTATNSNGATPMVLAAGFAYPGESGKMEKMGKGDRDKYVTMIELLLVHETAAAMAAKHARPGSDHDGVGEVEVEPSSAGTNDEL